MNILSGPDEESKVSKSIWLITFNVLCERFNYYGFKTILVLYLTTFLNFNEGTSTIIYYSFTFLSYIMSLTGAILADTYWGKFKGDFITTTHYKTIIRLSTVYALGSLILTGSSMTNTLSLRIQKIITLLGLFLISVGTGGIRPCIFAFGGDQFQLPQQAEQLQRFIIKFMTAESFGALASSFLTPSLRNNVHCFGENTCYPLAFGVPAALMLIAIVIFVLGKNTYVKQKPRNNVVSRTIGCVIYAWRKKFSASCPQDAHWLDHARDEYTDTEISVTKAALNVIAVFTAYPMYWALYKQCSWWTLQATLMDGRLEFTDWAIKPHQMQTITPFFRLLFFFLFDSIFNPLLASVGVRKPLQKIAFSSCLVAVAFVFAALVQFKILGNDIIITSGEGRLNIYNGFNCNVTLHSPPLRVHGVDALEMINVTYSPVSQEDIVKITLQLDPECQFAPEMTELSTTVTVIKGKEASYYFTRLNQNTIALNRVGENDNLIKDKYGNPKLRMLFDYNVEFDDNILFTSAHNNSYSFRLFRGMDFISMRVGVYNLFWNGKKFPKSIKLSSATFYTLTLQKNGNQMDTKLFTKYKGKSIHLLWQLPQYFCMIVANIIFMVTSLEFSFTEAPINLKSFISAFHVLAVAIGNLFVVIVSALPIENQANEYLLYSGLMCINTLLFAYFSIIYRSNNIYKIDNKREYESSKEEETI